MADNGSTVTGEWLWTWREGAIAQAIAHDVPIGEVDWLLQALTALSRLDVRLATFRSAPMVPLSISDAELDELWHRRIKDRVPLQYLVGRTQWRQFELTVAPAVLIPRPETELIIDLAVSVTAQFPSLQQGHWVDLGTGSGAIALGLAAAFSDATIHGVDCSEAALAIAADNIERNGSLVNHDPLAPVKSSQHRIQLHHGSWFSPWERPASPGSPQTSLGAVPSSIQFSGIVSNPPYIPSHMVLELQPEVMNHEPHLALDGGEDGLDCLRYLIDTAPRYLAPHGVLILELMAGQGATVAHLLEQHGTYQSVNIHFDLAGHDRFVSAQIRINQ